MSLSGARFDVLLGAGLFVGCVIELAAVGYEGPLVLNLAALAVLTLSQAWRRRAPEAVALTALAAATVLNLFLTSFASSTVPFAALLVAVYGLGRHATGRQGVKAALAVFATLLALLPFVTELDPFPFVFVVTGWAFGRAMQQRTRLAAELHELTLRAQEERDAVEQRAVAEERRRIARELHDVVAHSVSVMVVQAGGARRILDHDEARALDAARLIADVGRDALAEMERLLVLEAPAEQGSLEALVERARGAGLSVGLRIEGAPRALDAAVEHTARRVVQEALTNVMKHAGGAATEVVLRYEPDALEVVVANAAAPAGAGSLPGAGRGLAGMAERVAEHGGALDAGAEPGGGYVVRARLPLALDPVAA
jgi:signal transduction histidine kinase